MRRIAAEAFCTIIMMAAMVTGTMAMVAGMMVMVTGMATRRATTTAVTGAVMVTARRGCASYDKIPDHP
jgi:hypothetical protein